MTDKYILDGNKVLPEPDLIKWGKWLQTADRIVAKTQTKNGKVSTVFLGLDHNFSEEGPPVLFETLVFGGTLADEMFRYSTWEEARADHEAIVKRVENATNV